ncbi:antibiotic biosynthesis monooxygenase family protein [Arenimonas sp.]|uniref:antibiotic biosynthesis monooxygenase family protein n=1 Tax=Arenimonas sp. TaxID=1872635 RepID=UPI0039E2DA3C
MNHLAIWEYEVRAGAEAAFETLYGPEGGWAALFRQYAGYLGTELLKDPATGRYLTIDRWLTASDYDAFLAVAASSYAELDAQGDALTASERRIGRYDATC